MKRSRGRGDDGVVIVLFALLLVVLLIFSAFAIDFGRLYNDRRQTQSAADSAALAGVQDLASAASILTQVDQRASNTLGVSYGTIDWTACSLTDPDPVDTPIAVAGVSYPCITTSSAGQLQVKVPERSTESVFGRVIGKADYSHSAFAIAGIQQIGLGSILPFGLPASGGAQNAACLKDGPHSEAPCNGPDTGNFGYLDFTRYGNTQLGTTELCTGQVNERISENIAAGVDHDMQVYPDASAGRIVDNSDCGGPERRPTSVRGEGGNKTSAFGSGMYSGSGFRGRPARLKQTSPDLGWGSTETVDGYVLDDNPLWQFIAPLDGNGDGAVVVPASCSKSQFTSALADNYGLLPETPINVRGYISSRPAKEQQIRLLMDRCITHFRGQAWNASGAITGGSEASDCPAGGCVDVVFGRDDNTSADGELFDIQLTSRFAYVPQLTTEWGSPATNPSVYDFATFRAVYLDRLVGGCNSSGSACSLDFEPGPRAASGNDAPNQGQAEAITAWVFPPRMLPNRIGDPGAPFEIGVNRVVRLTR